MQVFWQYMEVTCLFKNLADSFAFPRFFFFDNFDHNQLCLVPTTSQGCLGAITH